MARKLLLLFCISYTLTATAQQAVSVQGGTYSTAAGQLDFSLGEVAISTISTTNYSLTQGVLQPALTTLNVDEFERLSIKIYPNPSTDFINIKLLNFDSLAYTLYDIQGRRLKQATITNRFAAVNLQDLAHGVYLLKVENSQNDKQKTYRIIKN